GGRGEHPRRRGVRRGDPGGDPPAIGAVREAARQRPEDQRGEVHQGSDRPRPSRPSGALGDVHPHRDGLHPGADVGDEGPGPEADEVGVTEGAQRRQTLPATGGGAGDCEIQGSTSRVTARLTPRLVGPRQSLQTVLFSPAVWVAMEVTDPVLALVSSEGASPPPRRGWVGPLVVLAGALAVYAGVWFLPRFLRLGPARGTLAVLRVDS